MSSKSAHCQLVQRGVQFSIDGRSAVVSRQTLHDVEAQPFTPFDDLVRFNVHRDTFEAIARRKIASGALQSDGSVLITNGDLTTDLARS